MKVSFSVHIGCLQEMSLSLFNSHPWSTAPFLTCLIFDSWTLWFSQSLLPLLWNAGTHPASYPNGIEGSYPGGKVARLWR
jgi:hypothetical protein